MSTKNNTRRSVKDSNSAPPYQAQLISLTGDIELTRDPTEEAILDQAKALLESRIKKQSAIGSSGDTKLYLQLHLRDRKSECFCVLWLTNRHHVIGLDEMFQGTIDGASVHPREVVRRALEVNAAAAIFCHPHPSGVAEPSAADRAITNELKSALAFVGTRVLDHIVIGDGQAVSMAERGLM